MEVAADATDRCVLIAGVSGVVGFAAAHRFASQGWNVLGLSRRRPDRLPGGAEHLAVDLAEPASVRAVRSKLGRVTHVVYAALFEKPGLMPGWRERDQMEQNLTMLANLLDVLLAVAPVRHISLMQGTKAYGAHIEPMRVPGREREPRHPHENFYWLQQDHLRERQADAAYAWTILRPQVIYGEAQGGNMNALPALGAYAAVLRADGRPLDFPGGAPTVGEAVDADLLARMLEWAATSPGAANEIFNVTNGDVYTLRNVWPVLADAFGMDVGADVPISLASGMPARELDWARVVDRFDLQAPRSLANFVGQSFIYADMLLGHGRTAPGPPALLSTIKARHAGFADCVDTEDMFTRLVTNLQRARLLPPRHW